MEMDKMLPTATEGETAEIARQRRPIQCGYKGGREAREAEQGERGEAEQGERGERGEREVLPAQVEINKRYKR
jgi:hypothetical protein